MVRAVPRARSLDSSSAFPRAPAGGPGPGRKAPARAVRLPPSGQRVPGRLGSGRERRRRRRRRVPTIWPPPGKILKYETNPDIGSLRPLATQGPSLDKSPRGGRQLWLSKALPASCQTLVVVVAPGEPRRPRSPAWRRVQGLRDGGSRVARPGPAQPWDKQPPQTPTPHTAQSNAFRVPGRPQQS